ncbi:MAG TPA: YdeI/OmpD-associated family protein [Bacteroidales bacterium]|nr:YdeI/OmpD-associated family protein [Bacteroidales bacterium]
MTDNISTLYVTTREDWRKWLEKNHTSRKEVWLIYYKKHTCKPRIPYTDAVEEAICFGWIDSIIMRIDENTYCQKFTPRNSGSRWSDHNIKRAREMIRLGKMNEAGARLYNETIENPYLIIPKDPPAEEYQPPEDLIEELKKRKDAFDNFLSFPPSYRKLCIGWIESSKKPETRIRRINEVADKAARGEKIGMK